MSKPTTATHKPISAFTAVPGLYKIRVQRSEVRDQIHCRISQLEAQLAMTYGEQGEAFRSMSDALQDSYMWACGMAIREIRQLWDLLGQENRSDAPSSDPA